MQSGAIREHQLIASSEKDNSSRVGFARLHYQYKKKPKSWVPLLDHRNQWLQVNLGNELTWVTGLATQGKQSKREAWVKKFQLRYWGFRIRVQFYKGHGDIHAKTFTANTDSSSVFHNELNPPVRASVFRFSPTEWHNSIALRIELYGCRDSCLSYPCLNGGTCNRNLITGGYTCSCSSGYNGDRCEIGDVCSLSQPCLNGGTCLFLHHWPYFRCSCSAGYLGHNCWYQIPDQCSPSPCFNGGTCEYIDEWPYFECECPSSYSSYNCGSESGDPCSPEPCLNGGTCTEDSNPLGFECSCPSGYIGFNCGFEQGDRCSDNPCNNDGMCTAESNLLGYNCNCTSEFVGFDCSLLKDDPCLPNPCKNDGNCTRTADLKDFTCNCTSEYIGNTCGNRIVHGIWSDWNEWPNCNKPCNGGSRTRKRTCDNPAPAFGGKNCEGLPTEAESCNLASCPAEMINYKLKLKSRDWNSNLASVESEDYMDLEDTIKKEIINFYNKRDEDVTVVVLEFRPGSVISSFNVTYPGIDSLQIVSIQEEIAGGALGETSAELLNITASNVPEAPLITEATSTTSTRVELKWTAVFQPPSAPLLGYVVVYKEINQKFQPDIMKSLPPNPSEAVLEDLNKFTNYTIRVYAFTSSGNGVSSKAVSVSTQEDVPSEPPPNSVIKSTSESSIHVSWEQISQVHVHGILLGYEVRYAIDDGSSPWMSKTLGVDEYEIHLKDLEYFTPYKVVVCARTSKGCGEEYSDIAYTFGDVPSKPPQSVAAERLKAAEFIKVTWSPVPFGYVGGLLMGYSIKYRRIVTAEKEVLPWEEETAIAKSTDLFIFLKVQTYSIYEIKVAAFTQKGMGPYSDYVYGETCRCPKILYTNYWSASPYLRVNRQDKKFGGILSNIVIDMIQVACDTCPEYGRTIVKTDSNGKGKDAFKKSLLGVLADINNIPQISFPIYGNEYITRFMGSNVYINLVESPGLAFIAVKRMPGTAARNMISAVLDCAPLVVLSGCMAFIAGFIVWVLDMKQNPDEFPASFSKGVGEGFWWSFISMTTVGYGDRSPRSVPARIFGIAWTLTGLVIISILIGTICSALTSSSISYPVTLYGTKIGAIQNSTEQRVGTLKNARVNEDKKYTNFEDIRSALEDGKVEGALLDTYVAAEHKDELFNDKIFVKEILDRPFGYGVVLSGAAVNVEQRCRDYISMQISKIIQIIQNTTETLDPASSDEDVEQSTGLFDGSSDMFLIAMASLIGMLGVAVIVGLIYHYKIFVPLENKVARLKSSTSHFASKEAFVEEVSEFVNSFYSELFIKINASKEKNKQAIKKIKEKHTVGKKLGGSTKSSKIPGLVIKNPVYSSSSAENSFDMKRKLIGPSSKKSLPDQTQQWHSPNSAALNRAEVLLRSKSSSNDHRQRDMGCETTLHNSKAKKSYTKPRKLNIVK
ncbi:uncharacterized protein [Pocillopora verrucosa]|uniref:uncharacterized protein n=1 Tax=Pocillopora verrucosa TaxID=203993 RepID=UPI0033425445